MRGNFTGRMASPLDQVLLAARQVGASDVHLKVGLPPIYRIHGELRAVQQMPPASNEVIATFGHELMTEQQRLAFEREGDLDLAYGDSFGGRYRINIYRQRGCLGMALRIIPAQVPSLDQLNLPGAVDHLADEEHGLVLVTGATGSGKSTTLAAIVDAINHRRACHVVTIEDPIEYVHQDGTSIINQRELGFDTTTYARALRAALRQDPDVILVGEMRDRETVEIALEAAETGHLVLSTLHTLDAVETVNRIVAVFPTHQQQQIRAQMAATLRAVVSQRLLPRCDGPGMVPAVEILIWTERVRTLIADPGRTRELHDVIAQGRQPYGMVSFDQSLAELVQSQRVSYEVALANATRPDDFALSFRGFRDGTAAAQPQMAKEGSTL